MSGTWNPFDYSQFRDDDDPNGESARLLLEEAAHAMEMEAVRVDADFQAFTRRMKAPGADRRAVWRKFWDENPDYAPRIIAWTDPEVVTFRLGPLTSDQRAEVIRQWETERDDDPPAT